MLATDYTELDPYLSCNKATLVAAIWSPYCSLILVQVTLLQLNLCTGHLFAT
jgi:hypothetical protein